MNVVLTVCRILIAIWEIVVLWLISRVVLCLIADWLTWLGEKLKPEPPVRQNPYARIERENERIRKQNQEIRKDIDFLLWRRELRDNIPPTTWEEH